MYIVRKVIIKSTISLFAGIAGAIGTQAGLAIWNKCVNDNLEGKTNRSVKARGEFA